MRLESKDITDENIKKILELFPNVATEAKDENGKLKTAIDFDKLKQELSKDVVDGEECYDFTWVGKKEAMVEANRPIRKTLRPCRDKSLNWKDTENIYIEGDNLEALKLLQESYLGKVKMIYIDPPYNTGKDFVYKDNFHKNNEDNDKDINYKNDEAEINFSKSNELFLNTESNGRFHSDWCSMIYSRLKLARNLLSDDGVIFISIDDNEVRNLKNICDEILGEDNFIAQIVIDGTPKNDPYIVSTAHEYCLVYAKNFEIAKLSNYGVFNPAYGDLLKFYKQNGEDYNKTVCDIKKYFIDNNLTSDNISNYKFADEYGIYRIGPIDDPQSSGPKDQRINPKTGRYCATPTSGWRCTISKWNEWISEHLIEFPDDDTKLPSKKTYITIDRLDVMRAYFKTQTRKDTDMLKKMFGEATTPFSNPKPLDLIKTFIENLNDKNAIVFDFFSGSATTAHACMQLNAEDGGNRKFIMVQLPEKIELKSGQSGKEKKITQSALSFLRKNNLSENICEIGKSRIKFAGKKIQEENPDKKIDVGFRVFKVDDTNMKDVYYSPNETDQKQLGLYESNIKDDRTDEDLLYGCLLDWGVELSLPHRVETIDGKRVHIVDEDALVACFEENIPESVIRKIAGMKPLRVVFRDSSFNSDDNKINVEEIFKLITPDTRVKVI